MLREGIRGIKGRRGGVRNHLDTEKGRWNGEIIWEEHGLGGGD